MKILTRRELDKEIRRLSVPAVLSNLAVPLLGLCDTAIAGHLGSVAFLGAMAVGAMMVNPVFWLFGFLRMGTSGMTAQCFGARDADGERRLLSQGLVLSLGIGGALWLSRHWLGEALAEMMAPDETIRGLAREYFSILMWGSPPMLATMTLLGWMLGMQNTVRPMAVSIGINAVNIPLSLTLVYVFDMGFSGIATGTVVADWLGLATALLLARPLMPGGRLWAGWRHVLDRRTLGRFFRVNTDIMLRSACIMAVSMAMTALGARLGDVTLAANAVMLQFFHLFSYFMDGLAFTGEALCGRFAGAGNEAMLRRGTARLLMWGALLGLLFGVVYAVGSGAASSLLTSEREVVAQVRHMWLWVALLPVVSVWAFIFDGVFIGLMATRRMLAATLAAAAVFFGVACLRVDGWSVSLSLPSINILWLAFLGYLATRGLMLGAMTPRLMRPPYNTD